MMMIQKQIMNELQNRGDGSRHSLLLNQLSFSNNSFAKT